MFSLTIAVGNTAWALMYKTEEAAKASTAALKQSVADSFGASAVELIDDYGQTAYIPLPCQGFVLEDLTVSKSAHIERALQQARTHAEAQTAWQNDPAARAAARGPSVLAPGMMTNGRFPQ